MDVVVVNSVGIFEFAMLSTIKRGKFIFFGSVKVTPIVERFYFVHSIKYVDAWKSRLIKQEYKCSEMRLLMS
jgi:hypothetical protein